VQNLVTISRSAAERQTCNGHRENYGTGRGNYFGKIKFPKKVRDRSRVFPIAHPDRRNWQSPALQRTVTAALQLTVTAALQRTVTAALQLTVTAASQRTVTTALQLTVTAASQRTVTAAFWTPYRSGRSRYRHEISHTCAECARLRRPKIWYRYLARSPFRARDSATTHRHRPFFDV
jgi:hypothetical protein